MFWKNLIFTQQNILAMKKIFLTLAVLSAAVLPSTLCAQSFVDKSASDSYLNFGVRVGLTSSNLSTDIPEIGENSDFSWRNGFTAGVAVDINFRNYFSIQPGFFFENRSHNYTLIEHDPVSQSLKNEIGHTRYYAFTVPVLASFHFNLTGNLRWNVELGPYFSFGTGDGKDEVEQIFVSVPAGVAGVYTCTTGKRDYYGDGDWQHRSFDWGLKIGTGIRLLDHFTFHIHYQRGFRNASANYRQNWEMFNKNWTFAVGYDF